MTSLPKGDDERDITEVVASSSSSPVQTDNRPSKTSKGSLLSNILTSPFSIFEVRRTELFLGGGDNSPRSSGGGYDWRRVLRRIVNGGMMWRLQERLLGAGKTDLLSSPGEVWLLGKCYKVSSEEEASSGDADPEIGHSALLEDFSSKIWITYRKGFDAIGESKYTSDVNWGCMIRSSQMLVAQALLFHHLGRSWRKPSQKPYSPKYIEILHLFGDSEASAFSIHNLIEAGKRLSAGSWVGPYAMCRAWEALIRANRERSDDGQCKEVLPMVVYVVSGDEDGERGGAPVVCIEVASQLCLDFTKDKSTWAPVLLLVPLVLGLEKVNPRYIPLLKETFTFPQSLGILGGRSASSTYIVGIQDDKALYLDPHEAQMAVNIERENLEANTSSYHCSTIRDFPLEQIDPSLAIGFYCHDKDDFDDFCSRASDLGDKANGAPLFTVAQSVKASKPLYDQDPATNTLDGLGTSSFSVENFDGSGDTAEDEWQIL